MNIIKLFLWINGRPPFWEELKIKSVLNNNKNYNKGMMDNNSMLKMYLLEELMFSDIIYILKIYNNFNKVYI